MAGATQDCVLTEKGSGVESLNLRENRLSSVGFTNLSPLVCQLKYLVEFVSCSLPLSHLPTFSHTSRTIDLRRTFPTTPCRLRQ